MSDVIRRETLTWDASYKESRECGVRRFEVVVQTADIHGEGHHAETIRLQATHAASFGGVRAFIACDRSSDRTAADECALDQPPLENCTEGSAHAFERLLGHHRYGRGDFRR